jgi:lambda family phage portal protein
MKIPALYRVTKSFAPVWTERRLQALRKIRGFDAASTGRRTSGWRRNFGNANTVNARALVELRLHARDLERNNPYASKAIDVITGNAVGWGISPKPIGGDTKAASELWKRWADTPECDVEGRLTFAGIQELAMASAVRDGAVLLRRRRRKLEDGLAVPIQIQILEVDHLDTAKDGVKGPSGGMIIQGVEFDQIGRRVAYWLFPEHPGSGLPSAESRRVSASDILHLYLMRRPGQVNGTSWLATTIAPLKDFDDYEDSQIMKQKIAACFAAFIVNPGGDPLAIGQEDEDDDSIEEFGPGQTQYLTPGEDIRFANPPSTEEGGFSTRVLRKIAAGMRITYEDLSGDYSQVNFSSARMARLAHWREVHKWRWNMLIPVVCDGVWNWFVEAADQGGLLKALPERASWTCPPMPMLEPDKEGLALMRLVRTGAMTPDQMVREQGYDPDEFWPEYAASFDRIRKLGIDLDSDASVLSQAGQKHPEPGAQSGGFPVKKKANEDADE